MLRLTEIKLPLDHEEQALAQAIRARLALAADEPLEFAIFRRGVDARKKSAIAFIYTVDVRTQRDAELLAAHAADPHVMVTPDTRYRFVDSGETVPARRVQPGPRPSCRWRWQGCCRSAGAAAPRRCAAPPVTCPPQAARRPHANLRTQVLDSWGCRYGLTPLSPHPGALYRGLAR